MALCGGAAVYAYASDVADVAECARLAHEHMHNIDACDPISDPRALEREEIQLYQECVTEVAKSKAIGIGLDAACVVAGAACFYSLFSPV